MHRKGNGHHVIDHLPRRVAWSAALTAPVTLIEMSRHLVGWPNWHGDIQYRWQVALAMMTAVVVFGPGWPLLVKGLQSFARRRLNMFSMIAPGILITFIFSLLALVAPEIFPASFKVHGYVPVYFEAAAMITTLVLVGQWLESRAERHTGDALAALANLTPKCANVIRDGREESIEIDALRLGDLVQLRAGDRVPADGCVTGGELAVDESMLTGEPLPANKAAGDQLTGGTLIMEGVAVMRVEKTGGETVLASIIRMVEEAQGSKAPVQRLADRVTGKLVPAVMVIAFATFIIWYTSGVESAGWLGLLHAVTVLMITCPCALGLATPVSITTGLGRAARSGILIRKAEYLETLASIDTLALDKTGTLTLGKPVLHAIITCGDIEVVYEPPGGDIAVASTSQSLVNQQDTILDTRSVLAIAASLEQYSHHPLARAIVEEATRRGIQLLPVEGASARTGGGMTGRISGDTAYIGSREWLEEQGITTFADWDSRVSSHLASGGTLVWLAIGGDIVAALALADTLKPDARDAIRTLHERGMRMMLISGDNEQAALHIARQLGLDDVRAGIKPGGKSEAVMELRAQGRRVAMAGDGINDAPALAAADVGIALGTGTEVVMASGGMHILRGELNALVEAVDLSRAVMRNIRQNLFFAFAYNAIMIPVAAGVLYPWTGWMLTPMLASVAMSASSISVISNALRLRRWRRRQTAQPAN
jgi:P-type Cu+ transporter